MNRRFSFGRFQLLPAQRMLLRDGERIALGSRAFDMLAVLAENAGSVVSNQELLDRVWGPVVVDEGSLRVHMTALRKALLEKESGQQHIANVPRRGYCLITRVTAEDAAATPTFTPESATAPLSLDAPLAPGSLIGREEAMAHAEDALLRQRFVTVTGPGGIGKTSVAVAVATRLRAERGMRVAFVDLGRLQAGEPVEATVEIALRNAWPMPTQESAVDAPRLLLLDNCEHVVDAAALFAERCVIATDNIHVLATSREPLRARGEWVQRLQPLKQPPVVPMPYSEALGYAAFALFVERASAAQVHYGDPDVTSIARLCQRLEGNPLALELAASQASFFGLAGLLAQLELVGDIPAAGWRTAQPRHHSMTESLRWSCDLLTPGERSLFKRLSALRGPFALEAAISVAPADESGSAAQTLMSLVHKSLVWADPNGPQAAYRMCETTRSFAAALVL